MAENDTTMMDITDSIAESDSLTVRIKSNEVAEDNGTAMSETSSSDESANEDSEGGDEDDSSKEGISTDNMVQTLAGLMALDLEKAPEDAALKDEILRILYLGAERLAGNFREHGTPSKGGFMCGTEALDEIGKTCEDTRERLEELLKDHPVGWAGLSKPEEESDSAIAEG